MTEWIDSNPDNDFMSYKEMKLREYIKALEEENTKLRAARDRARKEIKNDP